MSQAEAGSAADHEDQLVAAFIRRRLQPRFRAEFFRSERRASSRSKLRARWCELLTGFEHWVDRDAITPSIDRGDVVAFAARLPSQTPGRCYAVSQSRELDGRFLPIAEALEFLDSQLVYGTVLSIVPGRLAYYSHAEREDLTWVLSRGLETLS